MNWELCLFKFTILFYGGRRKSGKIRDIHILSDNLQKKGISSIRQIIFELISPPHFPYGCHNISLCNAGNTFTIQFYHYYNSFNQLIILHPDSQYRDYCTLLQMIHEHDALRTLLEPRIIPPLGLSYVLTDKEKLVKPELL